MTYLWLNFSFGRMMRLLFGILECFPSSAVAVEFDGN